MGAVVNGAPGEKRRAAAGSRWRHGAFSAAAAFARLCECRLAKAKCGKVDSFQSEAACAAAQVEPLHSNQKPSEISDFRGLFLFLVYCGARDEGEQSNLTMYCNFY